jgi:DNA-binding transcriptional ArsR family regulator
MLDFLATRPRSAGEIASRFPRLSQPGVSQHLRVLREAQLVSVRALGQRRIYAVKPDGLRELRRWVSKYRGLWSDKLDSLEEYLDSAAGRADEMGKIHHE